MLMGEGKGHEIVLSLVISGLVPPRQIVRLLRTLSCPQLGQISTGTLLKKLGLTGAEAGTFGKAMVEASALRKRLQDTGVGLLSLSDGGYPRLLREIHSPPPLLFFRGDIRCLDWQSVAVVGSRNASLAGAKISESLGAGLAGSGFVIVSGLARGIDTAAHRGALSAGGRTVAVMGSGIDIVYPSENSDLAESIRHSGVVITEQLPGTPPLRQNFPQRNRIISGLALGTVVVEAGRTSGALITADCALRQNRSVFAVPSTPGFSRSRGTNRLLKEGATLVESVDDVLEELGPQLEPQTGHADGGFSGARLTPDETRVVDLLSSTPVHVDEISRSLGVEANLTLSLLFGLEARGLIRSMPGKFYVREMGAS
jgi:DNA processing protein